MLRKGKLEQILIGKVSIITCSFYSFLQTFSMKTSMLGTHLNQIFIKLFLQYSDHVFKTLQSFKIESVSHRNDLRLERDNQKDEERFFAKYLTNQNLLQLQLSDSNFRRYIYLQFLILFHYLQTSAKSKQ